MVTEGSTVRVEEDEKLESVVNTGLEHLSNRQEKRIKSLIKKLRW